MEMISDNLTLGTIIEKLETKVFNIDNPTEFEIDWIKRENGIKETLNICMAQIVELGTTPGLKKLTERQKLKSKKCVENISIYIKELIDELDEEKIKNHCLELQSVLNPFSIKFNKPFEPDYSLLISNSFHTAIITEILWAPNVTILQAMKISRGKLDLNDLGESLPELLNDIENTTLPYLKNSELYNNFYDAIKESLNCYSKEYYRGCNLIIMTTIEGMVRKLATFLSIPHELDSNFNEENYTSLNSLLRKVKWKKDFKIDSTSLSLLIGHNKTLDVRRNEYTLGIDKYEMVDLNTRLDFLKGRFKDDRDLILHGSYQDYNKKWNLFLNFSALVETQKVCSYYDKLYNNQYSAKS